MRTRTPVEAIDKIKSGYVVRASTDGKSISVEADLVVHAAGRAPAFETLDLETGAVSTENNRLKLNDYLQSVSNPAVYAAGDAAQMGPPLTPVASMMRKSSRQSSTVITKGPLYGSQAWSLPSPDCIRRDK